MGDKITVLEVTLLYGHLYQIDYINETKGYRGRMFVEKDKFSSVGMSLSAEEVVSKIVDEIFEVSAYSKIQIEQAKRLVVTHDDEVRQSFAEQLRKNITAAIDSNMRAIDECDRKYPKGDNDIALEFRATCNGKKLACQGILDYIDELVGSGDNNG